MLKYENITFEWYYVLDFGKLLRYNMRVRVETNKKEAIGVAPFLITFLFSFFVRIGVLTNITIQPQITS